MKYTDKGIYFNNVKSPGPQVSSDIIGVQNNYTKDSDREDAFITSKHANIINAIDIDWNEAFFNVYGTPDRQPKYTISTTGDLLNTLRECIDTSYTRANEAYELASAASGNTSGVFMFREDKSPYKYVTPTNSGEIKLSYISDNSYLPVNINFEYANSRLDFGISKDDLVSYLRTTDLGGEGIEYSAGDGIVIDDDHEISVNTDAIATRDYVNSKIINYSEGEGISIDSTNNQISVDTDIIATKEYVDSKKIKVGTAYPIYDGADSTHDSLIRLDYAGDTFTLKDGRTLDLSETILNKINSAGSQGIEYTSPSGSGINVNNTNHTISIDNTVALKSEIPNVSNYLTKDGETTGPLAVINGTQVNASAATINGSDIYISSDRKLKDNILDIRQDEVDKLFATESGNMHYFEWRESHKPSFGFIAQELIDFAPETVTKDSEYMQVNYNAALTKTCAALFKKIKELENRIEKLENK